jgi:predicted amidohydrolase YtcJ
MAARLTAFVVSAIVAITFVAGLIVGAQREDESGPIDLIVYNGHIYVGDPAKGFAEAIAVRGNRILRVGSNHDIKRFMRRATTLIDAKGGSVLPGFNDAALDLFAEGFELDAVRQTIADAHRVGLTSAHVTLRSADDLVLLEDLEKRGELTLRVSAALTATMPIDAAEVDRFEAIRRLHPGDALLKVASVRLVVPVGGIVASVPASPAVQTPAPAPAPVRHGRAKKSPAPVVVINADNLATAIAMLDQHGWQVIVAPADTAGVEMTLAAFEQALSAPRLDNAPRRHRIELPAPPDASISAKLDALGIIQSLQSATPALATAGATSAAAAGAAGTADVTPAAAVAIEPVADAMPPTRLAPISARAIFRSDWPARPFDPRITLAAAIAGEPATPADTTKPSGTATERAAWLAGAIDAYTARAAYASFDETRKGTIAKDMLADFVIFTTDLFEPKPETPITDAAITTTVANGRIVFSATATKPALSTAP